MLLGISEDVRTAWQQSFLGDLPEDLSARLLDGVRVESVSGGEVVLRGEGPELPVFLVVEGLLRVFLRSRDGRQATARYAAESEIIGLPPLLAEGMAVIGEAVTDARLVRLPGKRFKAMASTEAPLAWATARYLALQVATGNDTLSADIFLPVRARVARHLLDLAQEAPAGLVVRARHQYIADAVGSVREVVSREMKRLAEAGVITRVDEGVLIVDLAGMHRIASGAD